MKCSTITLVASLIVLGACQSDDNPDKTEFQDETADAAESMAHQAELDGLIRDFGLAEGNWVEKDGIRICKGYLTRFEEEDFCASDIPEDWRPFEYNGRTYYVQPLAGS